jgi:hypothetical protein
MNKNQKIIDALLKIGFTLDNMEYCDSHLMSRPFDRGVHFVFFPKTIKVKMKKLIFHVIDQKADMKKCFNQLEGHMKVGCSPEFQQEINKLKNSAF